MWKISYSRTETDRQTDRHDDTNSRFSQFYQHAKMFYILLIENKRRFLPCATFCDCFIKRDGSVHRAVRTGSFNKVDYVSSLKVNHHIFVLSSPVNVVCALEKLSPLIRHDRILGHCMEWMTSFAFLLLYTLIYLLTYLLTYLLITQ